MWFIRSLCLKAFEDMTSSEYREALAIIRAGQAMLAAHPRLDMPGFEPNDADRRRLAYHALRREIEARSRRMIAGSQGD